MADPGKFDVDTVALRKYVDDLHIYQGQGERLGHAIGTAHDNVTDVSWGIVGLFVLDKYKETAKALQDFLHDSQEYLGGVSDRLGAAASTYEGFDEATKLELDAIGKGLEESARQARVAEKAGVHVERHEHKSVLEGGSLFKAPDKPEGPIGEWADFCSNAYSELKEKDNDTGSTLLAVGSVVADGIGFAHECMEAYSDIIKNPFRFLVQMGLDFLLEILTPIQDLLHLVSGDPKALEHASKTFEEIDKAFRAMRTDFVEHTKVRLAGWGGMAAKAAEDRLTDFAVGIAGLADRAGSLAELLAMSSIVMEVIYELIKSIISEFVMWLIGLWIPALSAAAVTFGASLASAGLASAIKGAETAVEAMSWTEKLMLLLHKLQDVLLKIGFKLAKAFFKLGAEARRGNVRAKEVGGARTDDGLRQDFDRQRTVSEFDQAMESDRAKLGK